MDHAWTFVAIAALTWTLSSAWSSRAPPCFLMHEWTGAEVLAELGPLDRATVERIFEQDMRRTGRIGWRAKLPPSDAAHYLPVAALSSQMGLAFMYAWLVAQFAPTHVPCHDSSTHRIELTDDSVQHTLRYRLRALAPHMSDGPAWRVQFVARFCPHRHTLLHAKVVAAPWA